MTIESATYISDLVATNPAPGDNVSEGDDHIRLMKTVIKATLPSVTSAVTATHTEINKLAGLATSAAELGYVTGVTSAIQTQLGTKFASPTIASGAGNTLTAARFQIYVLNSTGTLTLPVTSSVVGDIVILVGGQGGTGTNAIGVPSGKVLNNTTNGTKTIGNTNGYISVCVYAATDNWYVMVA